MYLSEVQTHIQVQIWKLITDTRKNLLKSHITWIKHWILMNLYKIQKSSNAGHWNTGRSKRYCFLLLINKAAASWSTTIRNCRSMLRMAVAVGWWFALTWLITLLTNGKIWDWSSGRGSTCTHGGNTLPFDTVHAAITCMAFMGNLAEYMSHLVLTFQLPRSAILNPSYSFRSALHLAFKRSSYLRVFSLNLRFFGLQYTDSF